MSDVKCYSRVSGRGFTQEWYETASRHAGRRARQLRKLGYSVSVEAMGPQLTDVGYVKMSLLSIRGDSAHEAPEVVR